MRDSEDFIWLFIISYQNELEKYVSHMKIMCDQLKNPKA